MKTKFPATVEMHKHVKKYSPATAQRLRNLIAALHRPLAPLSTYSTTTDEVVQTVTDLYLSSAENYNGDLVFQFRREIYGLHDMYIMQRSN